MQPTLSNSQVLSAFKRLTVVAAIIVMLGGLSVLLGVGWQRPIGQRIGHYGTEFGLALFATLNITVFLGLAYWSARRLNQADAKREAAHAALRESEERFRLLVNATPAGLILVAPDGRIVLANPAAERLFGYGAGRLPGQPIEALVPERLRVQHPTLRQAFSAEARQRLMGAGRDLLGLRQDGAEFPVEIDLSPVEMPQGRFTLACVADITGRKQAEEQLAHLASFPEQNLNPVAEVDLDGEVRYANPATLRAYPDLREKGSAHAWLADWDAVTRPFREGQTSLSVRDVVVGDRVCQQTLHYIPQNGFVRIYSVDVTERKRVEAALRESEQRLNRAQEIAHLGSWELDLVNDRLTWSDEVYRIFGLQPQEFGATYTAFLEAVHAEDRAAVDGAYSGSIREGRDTYEIEHRVLRRPDGEVRFVHEKCEHFRDETGRIVRSQGMVHDITESRRVQAQLSAALQEKEVLLKEIHHRVKNNLQVISSLLRLQSAALEDPRVRELFVDSQRRVRAMALIHEQLYQSSNLFQINFESYILNLVNYLRRSYARAISEVDVRVTVENVILEMDQAMPLGLLVSELVSNSLKYAFPSEADAQVGEVWIVARREPLGSLTLIVGDNGVGLPDEVDIEHSTSMGLHLVKSFVAQLQGQFTVQRKPGTVFAVTIPERRD